MKYLMKIRAVRVIAILLSALFAVTAFASFGVSVEMYDRNFFSGGNQNKVKRDIVENVAYDAASVLFNLCVASNVDEDGMVDDTEADAYAAGRGFYYSVYALGNYYAGRPATSGMKVAYRFTYTMYSVTFLGNEYNPETDGQEPIEYYVELIIPESRTYRDAIYYADVCFDAVYENKYNIVAVCVASAVLTVLTYSFAVASAGKRRNTADAVMTFFDKIPFDILLFAEFMLAALICELCNSWWYEQLVTLIILCVCIFVGSVTLTLLSMTAVVRIKNHTFVRNNVTVMAALAIWRFTVRIVRAIPMFWRSFLLVCAVAVLDFMSVLIMVEGGFPLPYIFLWIAVIACASFAAYNMSRLKKGAEYLASGELDRKISTDNLLFDFRRHAENLNSIGDGMSAAVEERMKGERFKTELITNVSHDIKTPVTSIINYVDLLDKCGLENEDARSYIEVLKRQSEKLKKLTEDIVEASKASSGVIAVDCRMCDLSILLSQAAGEYEERFTSAGLTLVSRIPEVTVPVFADGKLIFRIFDNLLGNALKYSLTGTRVHLTLTETDGYATASIVNVSREPLPDDGDELTERFVRGDASRHTDGSGLGLSIAKSLAELQGGNLTVKTDGDFFKATLRMKTVANDKIC